MKPIASELMTDVMSSPHTNLVAQSGVVVSEVGTVISVGDGIARIHGLEKVMAQVKERGGRGRRALQTAAEAEACPAPEAARAGASVRPYIAFESFGCTQLTQLRGPL